MKYNRLGQSNLRVSEIGMGCMSLTPTDPQAGYVIHKAIDYGVNFFDTADLYEGGLNEELVGRAISPKRKDIILATKVGNQLSSDGQSWSWNPSRAYIVQAVEASLSRLKTDYIDLYQLHGGTINDPIDETIEAFEILKEQGKIIEYGISSIRPNVIREYIARSNIASVMMQYSILDRRPEETCLKQLQEAGISVITRGSLAKGLLAGKPASPYLEHPEETVASAISQLQKLQLSTGVSISQLACAYVLKHESVATAAVGFRTISQIADLLENDIRDQLSVESMAELKQLDTSTVYQDHR